MAKYKAPPTRSSRPAPAAKSAPRPDTRKDSPRPQKDRKSAAHEHRPATDDRWIYGTHAALAALGNPARICRRLVIAAQGTLETEAIEASAAARQAGAARPDPEIRDRQELDHLLAHGAVHQGIAVEVEPLIPPTLEDIAEATQDNILLVALDQATDPRNVGAVLRSAAAFGAMAVLLPDRHGPHVTGTLAKAASGAVDKVPLVRVANLTRALETLKKAGFWCFGLAGEGGQDISAADFGGRTVLVMGAEGEGLRRLTQETCDHLVRIPIRDAVGSLNLANAAAIALYEAAKRQNNPGD